jgi:hypothetical protein
MVDIKNYINEELFIEEIRANARYKMLEAAEPIIQEAMKEIELKLRESLGSFVVGMIEHDFNIYKQQGDLVITVLHRKP